MRKATACHFPIELRPIIGIIARKSGARIRGLWGQMHALIYLGTAGAGLVNPAAAALAGYGVAVRGTKRPATIRALRSDIVRFTA